VSEQNGLLLQGVVDQAVAEPDQAVGEVVLGQPRDHALLLHVRPRSDVHDHVAQVLPASGNGNNKNLETFVDNAVSFTVSEWHLLIVAFFDCGHLQNMASIGHNLASICTSTTVHCGF